MKNMQTNDMEIEVLSKEEKREKRRQERMRSQKRAIIVLIVLILMLVGIVVSAVFLISKQKAAKMHQQEIQDQIAAMNSVEDLEETEISTEENIVEEEATEIEVSQGEEENNDGTDIVDAKVLDEVVEAVISEMTLEEKVAGLFIVTPESITGVNTAVQAGEGTKSALEKYPVGGLIYFKKNDTMNSFNKNLRVGCN